MSKKLKIYRAYVTREKGVTDLDIASQFKVSRIYVHQVVAEVRSGSKIKLTNCMINYKKDCLWQTKYFTWYEAVRNFRGNPDLTADFRLMLHAMRKDKFTTAEIAKYLKKDHATIRHHFKK